MHDRVRLGSLAARAANDSIQPDIEQPTTPAAESLNQSRRVKPDMVVSLSMDSVL
jgi:hypothetical protein